MTVEEYIKRYTRNCSNKLAYKEDDGNPMYHPWLTPENAEEVAIMAKDEALKNLWHDAQGDDLPEYEREVIVLCQDYEDDSEHLRVAFAHRPDPAGWDGKGMSTGEVTHFEAKTFGKGAWNWPCIKYWLDVELPKVEED